MSEDRKTYDVGDTVQVIGGTDHFGKIGVICGATRSIKGLIYSIKREGKYTTGSVFTVLAEHVGDAPEPEVPQVALPHWGPVV